MVSRSQDWDTQSCLTGKCQNRPKLHSRCLVIIIATLYVLGVMSCMSVRGMSSVLTTKHQSQRLILVAELEQWNCDIIGISETHRTGTEELRINEYRLNLSDKDEMTDCTDLVSVCCWAKEEALKALSGYNRSNSLILARFKSITRMYGRHTSLRSHIWSFNRRCQLLILWSATVLHTDTTGLDKQWRTFTKIEQIVQAFWSCGPSVA